MFAGTFEHWCTRSKFDGKMECSRMSIQKSLSSVTGEVEHAAKITPVFCQLLEKDCKV